MAQNSYQPRLMPEIAKQGGKWLKFTVTAAELTDNDTQQDITLFTLKAGQGVVRSAHFVNTEFSGAGTNLTVQMGVSADPNAFYSAVEIHTSGTVVTRSTEIPVTTGEFAAATAVVARFDSTGGNLVDITTGQVTLYCEVVPFDELATTTKAL